MKRPKQHRLGICLWSLLTVCVAACNSPTSNDLKSYALPSVPGQESIVGRTVRILPAGTCVVLHYPPSEPPPLPDIPDSRQLSSNDFAPQSRSYRLLSEHDKTTFNCATFALCELTTVTADEWIDPFPNIGNFFLAPAQIILDSYSEYLLQIDSRKASQLDISPDLKDGDILCFARMSDEQPFFVHLGRIQKRGNANRLLSKLGKGDVIESSVKHMAQSYVCDRILVFRPKKSTAS